MLYISNSVIMVDTWDKENGASGNVRHSSWSHFDRVMLSGIKELNDHLKGYGCPPIDQWEHNPSGDEVERYDWTYVGDAEGMQDDENGTFIYDVSIYVNKCELTPFDISKETVSA